MGPSRFEAGRAAFGAVIECHRPLWRCSLKIGSVSVFHEAFAGRSSSNRYCLKGERPSKKGSSNAPGRAAMAILDMGCKQRVQEAFEHLMSVLAAEEDRLAMESRKVEEQKQEANLQTKRAQDLMAKAQAILEAVQQPQVAQEVPAPTRPAEAAPPVFASPAPEQDLPPHTPGAPAGAPAAKAPSVKAPPPDLQKKQPEPTAPAPPPYRHWQHSDQVTFKQSEPNGTKDETSAGKMFQSTPNFKAPPEAVQKAPPASADKAQHPWEMPAAPATKKAPPVLPQAQQQAPQPMLKKAPPPQLGQPPVNGHQQAPTKKAPPAPPQMTGMD
ncbi:hypothetical protein AK812_SmicGene41986 [Symbiodinium microadriaticum]|uniref:Uncharacterized protein n=1 Tax=Symbiodinium microadriaticum TaxID=2951 RepID=A0A1Q9C4Q6_SYMMI|nr:hypothetical protein AK812_SmicGene41986 [Symbiodinium microadriaticum]